MSSMKIAAHCSCCGAWMAPLQQLGWMIFASPQARQTAVDMPSPNSFALAAQHDMLRMACMSCGPYTFHCRLTDDDLQCTGCVQRLDKYAHSG
jgi:hypothetical protein